MNFLQSLWSKTWKVYREKTAALSARPKIKGTGCGVEIAGQTAAGLTCESKGDEQGWLYTQGHANRAFGSWSQAVPAKWNKTTGQIAVMRDKTQIADTMYLAKTSSTSAGDSPTAVRVATTEEDGNIVPGIIVCCLNHASQEQVFFPIGGTTESGG